jgi:hypothetical protein
VCVCVCVCGGGRGDGGVEVTGSIRANKSASRLFLEPWTKCLPTLPSNMDVATLSRSSLISTWPEEGARDRAWCDADERASGQHQPERSNATHTPLRAFCSWLRLVWMVVMRRLKRTSSWHSTVFMLSR